MGCNSGRPGLRPDRHIGSGRGTAGRVVCVGAPENPRLRLARKFGAEATVDIEEITSSTERIVRVREIVGGFGADIVMDCSGHPSAGPEGIEIVTAMPAMKILARRRRLKTAITDDASDHAEREAFGGSIGQKCFVTGGPSSKWASSRTLLLEGVLGQEGVFSSDRIPTFPPLRIPVIADLPIVGPPLSGHTLLVYLAYFLVPVVAFFLYRTRWGLRVRFVGEAEDAASAAGINIFAIKFETMLLSGLFCGLAGAYLSLGYVSLFAKQMTNERGLIALASIFSVNGNPYWTAGVALLLGTATALSVRLPQVTGLAPQLLQLIP
jgi:hypothetical protein